MVFLVVFDSFDDRDSSSQTSALSQAPFVGKGVQIFMHHFSWNMLSGMDAKVIAHGKVCEVQCAVKVVCLETRVKILLCPESANGGILVSA